MVELRNKVLSLATELALQKSAEDGTDYTAAIPEALEDACERLGISHKEFIKMFIG